MNQALQQTQSCELCNEQTANTMLVLDLIHEEKASFVELEQAFEKNNSIRQRIKTFIRHFGKSRSPKMPWTVRFVRETRGARWCWLLLPALLSVAATPLRSPKDVSPAPVMRKASINPTLKTNVITRTLTRSEMVHPALLVETTNGVMVKVLWTNSIGSVGADFARLSWKGTNTLKVVTLLTDTNATSFQFYGLSNGPPWVIELVGVNAAGDGPISNVTFWDRWEDTVWNQSRKNGEPFSDFGLPVARWTNTPPDKMREYRLRVGRVRQ